MFSATNHFVLLHVISKFGIIPGKKALQKIIYFINEPNKIYQFQWNKYGPYSEELKYDLESSIADGLIEIIPIKLLNGRAQLNISLTENGKSIITNNKLPQNLAKSIDNIHNLLKEKKPREMELLASIHYIAKDETEIEEIYDILSQLKPESEFTEDEIIASRIELENKFLEFL